MAAERGAELILLQHGSRLAGQLREEVVGVEEVVAQKLPCGSVEVIGSGSADNVDISAGSTAIGSVVVAGLHFEFLNGVRSGNRNAHFFAIGFGRVLRQVIGVDAIELNIVCRGLLPVGGDILRAAAKFGRIGQTHHNAGGERKNLRVVAIGKWQGFDGLLIHGASQ